VKAAINGREQRTKGHEMSTIGHWTRRAPRASMVCYQVTDRLHTRCAVRVSSDELATTVSAWLAELGADSPIVEDLALAVRSGKWPEAHALQDLLSVDVTIAA
jgi:hypothetical protein